MYRLLSFTVISFLSQFQSFAQKQEIDLLFTNIHIVDIENNTVLRNQNIAIHNGKIVGISKDLSEHSTKIIDGAGNYIMPSLADAHIHLPETITEIERVLKLNLINGITKVRSMRGNWNHLNYRNELNNQESSNPKIYLTAPPIHRSFDLTLEEVEKYVGTAKKQGFDQIKILSIKNQSMFEMLNEKCKEYNMPLGGHIPIASEGVISDEIIFNSQYSSLEHLGGLIGQPESYLNRINYLKEKEVYVCPTLQWYAIGYGQYSIEEMMQQRGMEFIDTADKNSWIESTKSYRQKLGEEAFKNEKNQYALEMKERFKVVKELSDLGIPLLLSPDSSSKFVVPGFGLYEEMKLYKQAGLSNQAILKAATLNFADLFKENNGKIELGREADFIFTKENPLDDIEAITQIRGVFYNNLYLNSDELKKIAQELMPTTKNL